MKEARTVVETARAESTRPLQEEARVERSPSDAGPEPGDSVLIIHRSKPTGNFTILPNELLRDDRLSYCARAVLAELLSRPDGWETNADALSERARRHRDGRGEGRRAMRTAFAELEEAGYMVRHKRKGEKGRFMTVLEVYDTSADRGTARGTSVDGTSVNGTSVSGTSSGSTDARSTDEEDLSTNTLSPPPVPPQRIEPDPVHEREISDSFQDQSFDPIPGVDVYAAQLADADTITRVTASWTDAYKRSSNGSEPSPKAVARVRISAASRLRAGQTADDLALIAADMAETNLAWTDLGEHEAHWLNKQQQNGLTGTDATVKGWLDLADQLGAQGQPRPSVTDQRVQAALDLGRQMQAEHDARVGAQTRSQPYQSYREPTAEDRAADLGHF